MRKYRRIEVKAFRRCITVVSGEWKSGNAFKTLPAQAEEGISLNDSDACEPVEPDSPEGQEILVEALRTLEKRLSPQTRTTIYAGRNIFVAHGSALCLKLRSLYQLIHPKALLFTRKEK